MDERIKLSVFFFFPSKNGYKESVDEVYESDITWNDSIKGSRIYVYTSSEIWSNLSFHGGLCFSMEIYQACHLAYFNPGKF